MNQSSAIGGLRAALVKIMEAIEDGDPSFAYAIAEGALELPIVRSHVCPVCTAEFSWPGELENHLRFSGHGFEELAA